MSPAKDIESKLARRLREADIARLEKEMERTDGEIARLLKRRKEYEREISRLRAQPEK